MSIIAENPDAALRIAKEEIKNRNKEERRRKKEEEAAEKERLQKEEDLKHIDLDKLNSFLLQKQKAASVSVNNAGIK